MGIRWKEFEIPKNLIVDRATLTPSYGKFIAEPLERGFGTTFGNSLRRMLLSSIEGAAVTAIRIEGIEHHFSSVEGVLEDVPQIILNIRGLVLKMEDASKKVITLDVDKEGPVTAGDIKTGAGIEVINPDHYLFTLSSSRKIYIELTVSRGRGFVTAEENREEGFPIGVIPIDVVFSPIERVQFNVQDTRVVQVTDYDKLILEIFTNGSISPVDALNHAAAIWRKYLGVFQEVPEEEEYTQQVAKLETTSDLSLKLERDISDLELSVRSVNCLKDAGIETIQDLVVKSEAEMLKYRNFGKRSLTEILEVLENMGLSLNMKVTQSMESEAE
ncbi:DNA-directed RNA polymerase subunit alpha [PVC group bacterium (ex Bugula neritina AB1)]|nr:DNA-directed RNA polymerase subunit alpha [PVC group bacterium (ex Bugula neritina AB1)]